MAKNSVFKVTEAKHSNLDLLLSACRCWEKYLEAFRKTLPDEPLPYIDNEMSSVGSLASGLSRFSGDTFVIHEALVPKEGNQESGAGRCDLYAHFPKGRILRFEAKRCRHRIKVEHNENEPLNLRTIQEVFAKDEDEEVASRRSLIGMGLRDYGKSTGNEKRVRPRDDSGHVMLLLATVDINSHLPIDKIRGAIKESVKEVFERKPTIRLSTGAASRKSLAGLPTVGFVYVTTTGTEGMPCYQALLATMSLI